MKKIYRAKIKNMIFFLIYSGVLGGGGGGGGGLHKIQG